MIGRDTHVRGAPVIIPSTDARTPRTLRDLVTVRSRADGRA